MNHCVIIRNNADQKIVETIHFEDASSASSGYDDMVAQVIEDGNVHGVTYELRDRFGIRAARNIK
jgi:hypothetical protein